MGLFHADDWVELATQMLASGEDAAPIVDLAILAPPASRWSTDPLVAALCEMWEVTTLDPDVAVELVARALADDLRRRPEAMISAPMIRMIARLAPPDYRAKLANECNYAEEFLDCDCMPERVDPELEERLEHLPTLGIPDEFIRLLALRARESLPALQPHRGH